MRLRTCGVTVPPLKLLLPPLLRPPLPSPPQLRQRSPEWEGVAAGRIPSRCRRPTVAARAAAHQREEASGAGAGQLLHPEAIWMHITALRPPGAGLLREAVGARIPFPGRGAGAAAAAWQLTRLRRRFRRAYKHGLLMNVPGTVVLPASFHSWLICVLKYHTTFCLLVMNDLLLMTARMDITRGVDNGW